MTCLITFGLTIPLAEWKALQPYPGHCFEHLQRLKPATLQLKHRDKIVVWNPNPANHNIYVELLRILEYLPGQLARCQNEVENDADRVVTKTPEMTRSDHTYALTNARLLWKRAISALKAREELETTDYAWTRLTNVKADFTYSFEYAKKLNRVSPVHYGVEVALQRVEEHLEQLGGLLKMKCKYHFYSECVEFTSNVDFLRWCLHLCCRFVQPVLTGAWIPVTKQTAERDLSFGKLMDEYFTYAQRETDRLRSLNRTFFDHYNKDIANKSPEALKGMQGRPCTPLLSDDSASDEHVEYPNDNCHNDGGAPEHRAPKKRKRDGESDEQDSQQL